MGEVYAIASQKGGVGKTTTAISLGAELTRRGNKVLLVDVDAQGSLTASLGYAEGESSVHFYEAPLDMMSYVCLIKRAGYDFHSLILCPCPVYPEPDLEQR